MGNKAARLVRRPFKNYNVEDRAERVLAKGQDHVRQAPRHPTEAAVLEQLKKEDRGQEGMHAVEAATTRDEELHQRLKQVYVESAGENRPVVAAASTTRKLPESRQKVAESELGYVEPSGLQPMPGRLTVKQALELTGNHYTNNKQFDAEALAKQYKLDLGQTQKLLRYFQSYNLAVPKDSQNKTSSGAHRSSAGQLLPKQ